MATSICYSRSSVRFLYPFEKTIANPVLGHGMIKLLKPPHTARIWVRALHDPIQELSMTLPRHKPRYPTMATSICFSRSIVHFRYPFQKTIANPVLGHGMIKILKPPHTTRIVIRALHNDSRSELSSNGTGSEIKCWTPRGPGRLRFICEDEILNLLKSPLDTNLFKLPKHLSNLLEHMGTHSEDYGGLVYLYKKILTKPEHITKMWEIAGYNHTNKAADMLPHENQARVKWGGRSVTYGIKSGNKRKRGYEDQLKLFPLKSIWQMDIDRGHNGDAYKLNFEGKSVTFSRLPEGILGEEKSKSGLVSAEKNRDVIPGTQEPFDLAFKFGAEGPWLDQFVLYTRYAGPNVLVGKVWTEYQAEIMADLVIIKMKYPYH